MGYPQLAHHAIAHGFHQISDEFAEGVLGVGKTTWRTINDNHFSQHQKINVTGASSDLDYDASTEELTGRYYLLQFDPEDQCFKPIKLKKQDENSIPISLPEDSQNSCI